MTLAALLLGANTSLSAPERLAQASAPASAASANGATPLPVPGPAPSQRINLVPPPDNSTACLRPSDVVTACQPGQQLSLTPIGLPTARIGMVYKPRRLVTGGVAPYQVKLVEGSKPEGLDFTADGSLAGVPLGPVRLHTFTAHITDSSTPPLSVRQAYALRVEQPVAPRPPASAPVAAPPPPPAPVEEGPPHIISYMLLQDELDAMFPKGKPADGAAAAPEDAASGPSGPRRRVRPRPAPIPAEHAERMQAMLAPLVHVDYPTLGLFVEARDARRCEYYRSAVTQAAAAAKVGTTPAALACPPATRPAAGSASAAAPAASAAALVSPTLYTELLPDVVRKDLIELAKWYHPLNGTAKPPRWTDNGCGCAPPISQDWSYGVYPFWQSEDEQPQKIDFSLFTRIGYLGVQIGNTGALVSAVPLNSGNAGFARTARRFGTSVDLIVHRSEWRSLLDQPYQTEIIQRAVKEIVTLVDTPMTDTATLAKRYLLPGWNEPSHLFDGVSLFFDKPPTDPVGRQKFESFYASFVHSLITEMQTTRRPYALNIIVPATEIGQDGAYNFDQLWGYIQRAQKLTDANALAGADDNDYQGTTDISVSILALLEEPSSQAKKNLRASIDSKDLLRGHHRVAILNSIVPVLFHGASNTGLAGMQVNEQQLDDDLAYFKWQFGGMGFWPMPLHNSKTGPVIHKRLTENFSPQRSEATDGLCKWVCPNRGAARLLFMALLLTGIVAFSLYHWSCTVRRLGRQYLMFLWLGGALTLAVALALLSCDPQLASLREGNLPLMALLGAAVLAGMYYSLKPHTAPP